LQIRLRRGRKGPSQEELDKEAELRAAVTPEEQIKSAKILSYIGMALISVFLLMIGFSVYQNARTIGVPGTVVSYSSETTTNGGVNNRSKRTTYLHRFEFVDREGVTREASTSGDGLDRQYGIGDVVSIGYYPDDFSKVRIRSWFGLWKLQLTLLGLGMVLIAYRVLIIKKIRAEIAAKS